MDKGNSDKKRKKGYYLKASQKKRGKHGHWHSLEPGLRGFLITCNNREREAVREAYNVLEEYADDMFASEQVAHLIEHLL